MEQQGLLSVVFNSQLCEGSRKAVEHADTHGHSWQRSSLSSFFGRQNVSLGATSHTEAHRELWTLGATRGTSTNQQHIDRLVALSETPTALQTLSCSEVK